MNKTKHDITTSQTIGPFSHEAWKWATELGADTTAGIITISGIIYDGAGVPINDAQIESWQPDAAQAESALAIPGFRRVPSGENGEFELRLSAVPQAAGQPFAYITVFARGLVKHQFTAVFLEDDATLAKSAYWNRYRPHACRRWSPPGPPRASTIGISTCRASRKLLSSITFELELGSA
jgi:protocatechuate 3,4-dioxygenase alpha subunit